VSGDRANGAEEGSGRGRPTEERHRDFTIFLIKKTKVFFIKHFSARERR
jgi:hypothetical protein